MSVEGGSEPVWGSGGRELFYRQGTTMMAATIDAAGQVQSGPGALFDGDFVRGPVGHGELRRHARWPIRHGSALVSERRADAARPHQLARYAEGGITALMPGGVPP